MSRALACAAGVTVALLSGCAPQTGVTVDVMLADSCMVGVLPNVRFLRAEVLPCTDDPAQPLGYACTIDSPDDLVPLLEDEFLVPEEKATSGRPMTILVTDLTEVAARGVTRIRLALSGYDANETLLAYGAADVVIEPGLIVQQADPLVMWSTCGAAAGIDYDGDGAVGAIDCAPFDPTFVGGALEICDNGVDDDCFMGDQPCKGPPVNRGDQDGDGVCAIGADVLYAWDPAVALFCDPRGYLDCDDTDPAVLETCRCTDEDLDGWCAESPICAHAAKFTCNFLGGDCCDGPEGVGCLPQLGAGEVNPGVAEECDGLDRNCSGAGWDVVASPCFVSGPGGECAQGILCAAPGDAPACNVPPGAPTAEGFLCGGGTGVADVACVECGVVIGWDLGADLPCSDAPVAIDVPAPVATSLCAWSVVVPHFPLVVTESGSDCATGRFLVELTWLPGPGTYAFYARLDDLESGTSYAVAVALQVAAGACSSGPGYVACASMTSPDVCTAL